MENKSLSTLIIDLVVVIVLCAAILLPVIGSAEDSQRTTITNPGIRADLIGNDTITFTWDAETKDITIGTDVIHHTNTIAGPLVLLASDSGMIRGNYNGTFAQPSYIEAERYSSVGQLVSCEVTVTGSTKTISVDGVKANEETVTKTWQYEDWCIVPSANGTKTMFVPYNADRHLNIEKDSDIYAVFAGTFGLCSFKNSTLSNRVGTFDYTTDFELETSDYNNVYKLATNTTDGDYTINVGGVTNFAYVLVSDYIAVGYMENATAIISVLGIVPVVIICAAIIAIVRFMIKKE